jgi:hypothetical protein
MTCLPVFEQSGYPRGVYDLRSGRILYNLTQIPKDLQDLWLAEIRENLTTELKRLADQEDIDTVTPEVTVTGNVITCSVQVPPATSVDQLRLVDEYVCDALDYASAGVNGAQKDLNRKLAERSASSVS